MRLADVQLTIPAILDRADDRRRGTHSRSRPSSRRGGHLCADLLAIGVSGLGALCPRHPRCDACGTEQGVCVRPHASSACIAIKIMLRHVLPNVMGPVLVHRDHRTGAGHHYRGDPLFSRRRRATDATFARHAYPHRQQDFLFSGEWWITLSSLHRSGHTCAGRQPAGRLAARRAQSEAEVTAGMALLEVRKPARRVSDPAGSCSSRSTACRFEINEGEVLGVVGESGAGKSLTGSAIIGLLEPPGRVSRRTDPARGTADRQLDLRGDAARSAARRSAPSSRIR